MPKKRPSKSQPDAGASATGKWIPKTGFLGVCEQLLEGPPPASPKEARHNALMIAVKLIGEMISCSRAARPPRVAIRR